jgi:hypothetical protein
MSKTIIIAGDSWGLGEQSKDQGYSTTSHSGLTKYLVDAGHQVINLSCGGGSNIESSRRIKDFLDCNPHLNIDSILIFQTEWVRGLFVQDTQLLKDDITQGYQQLKDRLIYRFYDLLSIVSVKYNVPMYLIGGSSDTIWFDDFETEYPGLQIVCQSLTNLLLENTHRNLNPVHCIFGKHIAEEIKYIKKHLNNNADLELLLQDIEKGHYRGDIWENNKEYFWPDGGHPNRHSHLILFNFLKTQIPNL